NQGTSAKCDGEVKMVPNSGGTPAVVKGQQAGPQGLAIAAGSPIAVLWTTDGTKLTSEDECDMASGVVWQCKADVCSQLEKGQLSPRGIAAQGSTTCWTERGA